MLRPATLIPLVVASLAMGCADRQILPLVGEGPEIYDLLETEPPDDPLSSPLAAARRLHQSLMQDDADMVWTLLAAPTRRALDERGATIGASGRELIDASTLPGPGGSVRAVRFETLFFGRNIIDLRDTLATTTTSHGEGRTIEAVASDDAVTELVFIREEDGWKLLRTGF